MRRLRLLGILFALVLFGLSPRPTVASDHGYGAVSRVVMPTLSVHRAANPARSGGQNLLYHGGPVETTPAVYISFWGPAWSTGFSSGGYSSTQAQTYIEDFFSSIGGSSWANIDSQYCQGISLNATSCGTSGTHIKNSTGQLAGYWTDTTAVPSNLQDSDIAAAASRLADHFAYNPNATYIVLTPTNQSESGFATSWCAWHSVEYYSGVHGTGNLPYAYVPYQPDAGSACGMNFVNATNDSFGNGYFDGFSIVGGHEYAEAQTDPITSSGSYAWYDRAGSEIGDKCAWSPASTNITLGSNYYAVQPLWSNAVSACALKY